MKKIIGAIDIGTNSVLLTIAKKRGDGFETLHEEANITRLGGGLNRSGILGNEPMKRTLEVVKDYVSTCRKNGVDKIFAIGTAALRKAKNSDGFVKMVKKECGIDIDVISGEREAGLTYLAASRDFGSDIVVVDIGGGSTELVSNPNRGRGPAGPTRSVPIGSVILTEQFVHTDPISEREFNELAKSVKRGLARCAVHGANRTAPGASRATRLIATAGTATTLSAMKLKLKEYSHAEVHGSRLSLTDLDRTISTLRVLTVEERKGLPGLEPKRADVILAGAVILQEVMKRFGVDEATVSDRGVRWGVIYENLMRVLPRQIHYQPTHS